jgi:tryptophanyl-tRNA synthetase
VRVLSGIQPSGIPHLGNYLGAIRNWVDMQGPETLYCVVDLHSLTLDIEPAALRQQTLELGASLFAAGLDPELCTVFIQSHVPEHAQLNWLLECVASYGELTRMTQFKDKADRQGGQRAGLLTYPVLMAADILLYDTTHVPVGDDQRQHLELTRNIAERFNHRYGPTFVVPEGVIPAAGARVMDLQEPTRKMSKSISSPLGTIGIFDSASEIEKKVKKAVTDLDGEVRFDREAKPGVSNLLDIFGGFTGESPARIAQRYERYGDLKKDLAEVIISALAPVAARYHELLSDPGELGRQLSKGAMSARAIASSTYERAANAMGLYGAAN